MLHIFLEFSEAHLNTTFMCAITIAAERPLGAISKADRKEHVVRQKPSGRERKRKQEILATTPVAVFDRKSPSAQRAGPNWKTKNWTRTNKSKNFIKPGRH